MKTARFVLLLACLSFISACSASENGRSVKDETTPSTPVKVDVESGMFVIEHRSDSMDRGNHEYDSAIVGGLVVDPNDAADGSLSRGDVVYFKTPEFKHDFNPNLKPAEFNLARVIGLPKEKVKIDKGRIYIDGKKLEAFYGQEQSRGQELETANLDEIEVPPDHVFVLGDTWWRSIDSQLLDRFPFRPCEEK